MVVILAVVEPDQRPLQQCLHFRARRIDHSVNWFIVAFFFPADDEQIDEHFHVKEYINVIKVLMSYFFQISFLFSPFALRRMFQFFDRDII